MPDAPPKPLAARGDDALTSPSLQGCCAAPFCKSRKTGYSRIEVAAPKPLCCGCYCCADGCAACCSRMVCCPAPLRDSAIQAVPETSDAAQQFKFIVPTSTKDAQTWKVGAKDASTSFTQLTGAVTRHEKAQQLYQLERLVGGRRVVRRLVALHELRTGFEVQNEDVFAGTTSKEPVQWDLLKDRSRDELGAAAHGFLERMQGAMRVASSPHAAVTREASDADGTSGSAKSSRPGDTEHGGRSLSGLWEDGSGERDPSRQATRLAINDEFVGPDAAGDTRRVEVLATVVTKSASGEYVVCTLKAVLDMLEEESLANVRREEFNAVSKKSMAATAKKIESLRRARSEAHLKPKPVPAAGAVKALKRAPTHAGQKWTLPEAQDHSSDEDEDHEAGHSEDGKAMPWTGSQSSPTSAPTPVASGALGGIVPFSAAGGARAAQSSSSGGTRRSPTTESSSPSSAPGQRAIVPFAAAAAAEATTKRRAASPRKAAPLNAPWEARLAEIFVVEEFDVATRQLRSTQMAFDVAMSRLKHPRLVQAAVAFMQRIGLRGRDNRVRRSSILGLGASIGFSQAGVSVDDYPYAGRPDSALGMLGHGKFSDWVPLARMACRLGGRAVVVSLKMRFRRTMFRRDRAEHIREIRAQAKRAGRVAIDPNAFASTHALTRFVFEVTDQESGSLVMKQHANYSELLASQKIGLADMADDIIASMELAENMVHERQLEYLEQLQRSAAAEHEQGVRHVLPPSIIASRDEAARRIQEAVRRWRVRKREGTIAELVELLTVSPHAREELRVGLDSMHCTSIRQWLTGINPFSSSTSMMRGITSKRRALGARGRVFVDPITGQRRIRHPTRPKEPFEVRPGEPAPQVVEDVMAFLEEQITMQAVVGDSQESKIGGVLDHQRRKTQLVRSFLRSSHAAELGVGTAAIRSAGTTPMSRRQSAAAASKRRSSRLRARSGARTRSRSRSRSPSPGAERGVRPGGVSINKGRAPTRGLGAELETSNPTSAAPRQSAHNGEFRPLAPAIVAAAAPSPSAQPPVFQRAAATQVVGPDGPETGIHAALRRDEIAGARQVEDLHSLVISSPRNALDPSEHRHISTRARLKQDLGDMSVGHLTQAAQAVQARAGLLDDAETKALHLPPGAEGVQDLPSASPAHFMPSTASKLSQWISFLVDDEAYSALEQQWSFYAANKRPDTPPRHLMEGKTVYDAVPTLAPLPSHAVGLQETRNRQHLESMAGDEADDHLRRRNFDVALGGFALTLRATSAQAQSAAQQMARVRDRLSSEAAAQAGARAKTASMGTVLMYNEGIRQHAQSDALPVDPAGSGPTAGLSASRHMVHRLPGGQASTFAHTSKESMNQTMAIARRVREARTVIQTMSTEGELSPALTQRSSFHRGASPTALLLADKAQPPHSHSRSTMRQAMTASGSKAPALKRAGSYTTTVAGAKARPRTSLAHTASTTVYPVRAVAEAEARRPVAVAGVKIDGVDTMGFSGDWASGKTRRNAGGRWVTKAKQRSAH
jgi:hypothetical protein